MKKSFATYLTDLRINKSGAKTVAEFLQRVDLPISETFYRALENGDKLPTVETLGKLATTFEKAFYTEPATMFYHYLEDLLPTNIFRKLVRPVSGERPAGSLKEALDTKDAMLTTYRASFQKLSPNDIAADLHKADDVVVDFLNSHFDLLPLIHYIYMKETEASEEELRSICEANNIKEDLSTILGHLRKHHIAYVSQAGAGKKKHFTVRRFSRDFRLPLTPKGQVLRARWIKHEIARALRDDRGERAQLDKTFSHAIVDCYQLTESQLGKVQDRTDDLIAQLNAARANAEDPGALAFFVSITVSPRPEYFPRQDTRQ